jgi:hypothetical protein
VITTDSGEYVIGTDEEADIAQNMEFNRYLDDCIYPGLPGDIAHYFDEEAWKRDSRYDGRGHALSSYDGNEIEIADLYAYRID